MHSSGSMTRMRSASWMQSTGQTSTQDRSLMSMQGSAMMYVTRAECIRAGLGGDELFDDRLPALDQRGDRDGQAKPGRRFPRGGNAVSPSGLPLPNLPR